MKENKVLKWLDDYFEETLLVILLIIIAVVSMLQVFCRQLPFLPTLQWAEEFCRFAWIWSVFLSLPYTIKKANMLRVALLLDALPQKARKVFNMAVDLINTAAMAILGYYSIPVLQKIISSAELSPAMQWPMSIIYIILPVGFFLAVVRGIQMFIYHLTHFNERELTTKEQAEADAKAELEAAEAAEGEGK